ncbi:hypothetical protein COS31_01930 [Candidatus Roizmanbacteria bacterium CG02_land_8_20_14_3_00_36_15]|uniref:Uncharacterized protein n=2 Tax=Candidatus Roizmaniibacteriota TaxID=1752723 RepID=A0A2M8KM16_9BACT|nr:MAG: hypothetical protein COS51_01705 [Candidatus Roizmanbacteria bacterium CG03_land_8_20_14_0_80_36_21]PIV37981.1 MAG: hypothetical protein COS31_01930 [Candidatus Roizmanbacteria bacterium CG02_land_8_20_14_3_00_36_15]PIY69982.1 MAG: hypothetical protein COY89_03640 [Candidatus Roizmanbacteria bacterium CG_4_10_14_0_8_um_filter_36_36]PJA52567.1 MAG: hypothetical protein CO166_05360 [Candidatus Roizmanbacteria bacterium CG_4_9_14_3_um_filter_36_11]PJC82007.1 MAG: hypothetical protein CO007
MQRDFVTSKTVFPLEVGRFHKRLKKAGFPLAGLDIVKDFRSQSFQIEDYGKMVSEEMTKLAERDNLNIVIANSVGTISTLLAVASKIQKARQNGFNSQLDNLPAEFRLPKMLILVDPIFDGLTTVAQTYLEKLKEIYHYKDIPGLKELYADSEFLSQFRWLIDEVKDDLSLTVCLNGQAGENFVACPFAAVKKTRFDALAKKLGIDRRIEEEFAVNLQGNDGMCREGTVKAFWPKSRWLKSPINKIGGDLMLALFKKASKLSVNRT